MSNYVITQYASRDDLVTYVGAGYTVPADPEASRMLLRASELIYDASGNLSERAFNGDLTAGFFGYVDPLTVPAYLTVADYQRGLMLATCAQVEFWLEFGEEHDIVALQGSATAGRLSISNLPMRLSARARGYLRGMGLAGIKAGIR